MGVSIPDDTYLSRREFFVSNISVISSFFLVSVRIISLSLPPSDATAHEAAKHGNVEVMHALLRRGANAGIS